MSAMMDGHWTIFTLKNELAKKGVDIRYHVTIKVHPMQQCRIKAVSGLAESVLE
jgi:hypothetical protein